MTRFKKADIKHLKVIINIYKDCIINLLDNNILQWGEWSNNYPNKDYLKNSIISEELFIITDKNALIGAVILNDKQSDEWRFINWNKNSNKSLVIHALVICPKFQNKGYGKQLLTYCENHALENKYDSIRLDSFKKNKISNKLYEALGYKSIGEVKFNMKPKGNKEYICYEKLL